MNPLLTTFREKFPHWECKGCKQSFDGDTRHRNNPSQYCHILMEEFILYAEQKGYERALVECEEVVSRLGTGKGIDGKDSDYDKGYYGCKEDILTLCREAIRSKVASSPKKEV